MRRFLLLFVFLILGSFWLPSSVQAAVCSISTDTVVNQTYVTDNACTSINIEGNVSTTWIGTVDLGGGTVTVKTGYTMTMGTSSEMILGAADDFTVEANATTTHTAADPNGLKITARNVTITGALSANAKGCSGSVSAAQDGYGPSLSTGICEYGASGSGKNGGGGGAGGSGGSHGGASSAAPGGGAAVTVLYGDSLNPTFLGSGGGNGYYRYSLGGAGGGRITLTVSGLLDVDGSIVANGGDGSPGDLPQYNGAGGGSGGSIAITAESISGSGIVSANGGKGGAGAWGGGGGGGGGGGRIFVAYNASTFTLSNIQAVMGTGGSANGKSGTTYILNRTVDDGGGALTITSGFDFPAAGDYTRESITIESGAYLTCAAASTLTVSSTAWLSLNTVTWACSSAVTNVVIGSSAGISTTGTSITFSSTDHFKISAPTWTNEETTMSVTKAGAYTTVDTSNDLSFDGFTFTGATNQGTTSALGGLLIFPNAHALSLVDSTLNTGVSSTVMTSIFIDADSVINANGRGCAGSTTTGNGFGPHLTTGVCTISTTGFGRAGNGGGGGGGGAAHGGAGGAGNAGGSAQTTTYGDEQTPVFPGSGGGGGYYLARAAGGNGGGRIFLHTSGEFALFGNMSANGAPGLYGGSWNGGGGGLAALFIFGWVNFLERGSLRQTEETARRVVVREEEEESPLRMARTPPP